MYIDSQADRIKLDRFTGRLCDDAFDKTWDQTTYSVRRKVVDDFGLKIFPWQGPYVIEGDLYEHQ